MLGQADFTYEYNYTAMNSLTLLKQITNINSLINQGKIDKLQVQYFKIEVHL